MCVHVLQREREMDFCSLRVVLENSRVVEKILQCCVIAVILKKEETKVDQLDHVNRTPEICLFFFLSFCDSGIVYSNP